jgi:energy-converting hydrogenase Eha subunit C
MGAFLTDLFLRLKHLNKFNMLKRVKTATMTPIAVRTVLDIATPSTLLFAICVMCFG